MAGNKLQLQNGEVIVEEYTTGGSLGVPIPFGGTDEITLSYSVNKLEHYDTEGTENSLDGNDVSSRTVGINLTTADITSDMLERAHLASSTDANQAEQVGTAVVIASASLGAVHDSGYRNCTSIVVKDSTDTTTYTAGTDYYVNLKWGTITPITGGAISDTDELHLTVDASATTGKVLSALAADRKEYRLTFRGMSAKGIYTKYVFEKVDLSLDGDQQLKSTDASYSTISLTGSALKYNDKYYTIETFE